MGKDDDNPRNDPRDNAGYDLVNAEEICDTIDTIIKRHEADYTRLYVELDELFKNKDGDSQWQHTARWVSLELVFLSTKFVNNFVTKILSLKNSNIFQIKFEEDVDVGSKRWGKPHVGTLSVNAFQKMRKFLMQATILLDAQLYSRDEINKASFNK